MSDNALTFERNIDVVTSEIIMLRDQARSMAITYIIELGKRLTEAKALLPHGEWGDWLENKVEFSQKTATDYMRIYEEYGMDQLSVIPGANQQAISNLSYTKVLALLAVPREERAEFIEKNDVENISTRELNKAIKERDEALKRAEEAEKLNELVENEKARAELNEKEAAKSAQKVKELSESVSDLNLKLEKAKEAEKKAKAKLKELKENPTVPQETIDKLKAEAEAEASEKSAKDLEKKMAEANEMLQKAQTEKEAAELEKKKALEKVESLEKQLRMQNPDATEFKRLFELLQNDIINTLKALAKVKTSDPVLAMKFENAVQTLLKTHIKEN
ncbi:MAG: DUF3102 domain-containing protein [Clostridia bacterium]|nr:DUF3102 domain-containing protein [Clostridia bacterium]